MDSTGYNMESEQDLRIIEDDSEMRSGVRTFSAYGGILICSCNDQVSQELEKNDNFQKMQVFGKFTLFASKDIRDMIYFKGLPKHVSRFLVNT